MNSRDTSDEARRVVAEIEGRLTAAQRMRILSEMFVTGRALIAAGHRARFPNENEEQVEERVFRSLLGDELGERVWQERCRRRAMGGG